MEGRGPIGFVSVASLMSDGDALRIDRRRGVKLIVNRNRCVDDEECGIASRCRKARDDESVEVL